MIPVTFQRLITRGDLPNSDGGIYNPGAWVDPITTFVQYVCRVEADYAFQPTSIRPCAFALRPTDPSGPRLEWTEYLRLPYGFTQDLRFEDLRPFVFQNQVLVAGVRWKPSDREHPVRPVLAYWDYPGPMTLADEWALPRVFTRWEKNWVLLESAGRLYTVYSLSPLVIYRRTPYGDWALRHEIANTWEAEAGAHIKNSTHLLPFRGGYLGWWHTHDRTRTSFVSYLTGAYWLDKDLQLRAKTVVIFDGSVVTPTADIYKPGVLYISSYVFSGDDVLVFYGEGDSHTGVATIRQQDLADALGV